MSIPKIFGIETEWSIILPERENILADVQEFNLFLKIIREFFQMPYIKSELQWESCSEKAEIELKKRLQDKREMRENGGFLPNGARLYVDYPHLEYSTPECLNLKDLIAADKAGNYLLKMAAQRVSEEIGEKVVVLKDNSDRKGHSFASHENYLLDRKTFHKLTELADVHSKIIAFLVTRQIIAGSGKIGIERGKRKGEKIYQISQRADFINEIIGYGTSDNRNIINLRDEPHADSNRFARLHLILGDANFCEWALYLRVGTTALILKMLEDDFIQDQPCLADPVKAIKLVSRDTDCVELLELSNGQKMTSIDIQEWYWHLANRYAEKYSLNAEEKDVIEKWGWFLKKLRESPESLVGYADWLTKKFLIDKLRRKNSDPSVLEIADILYHDINQGLYYSLLKKGLIKRLISDNDIIHFVHQAPENTRAYLRGLIVSAWPELVKDWEEISYNKPIGNIAVEKDLTGLNKFVVIMNSPLIDRKRAEALFRQIQINLEVWKEV